MGRRGRLRLSRCRQVIVDLLLEELSTETRAAHSERGSTHKTEFFGLSSTAHAGSDEFHNFACSDYSGALATLGQVGGRMKILGVTGTRVDEFAMLSRFTVIEGRSKIDPPHVQEMGSVTAGNLVDFIVGFANGAEVGEPRVTWKDGEWGVVWVSSYQHCFGRWYQEGVSRKERGKARDSHCVQRDRVKSFPNSQRTRLGSWLEQTSSQNPSTSATWCTAGISDPWGPPCRQARLGGNPPAAPNSLSFELPRTRQGLTEDGQLQGACIGLWNRSSRLLPTKSVVDRPASHPSEQEGFAFRCSIQALGFFRSACTHENPDSRITTQALQDQFIRILSRTASPPLQSLVFIPKADSGDYADNYRPLGLPNTWDRLLGRAA